MNNLSKEQLEIVVAAVRKYQHNNIQDIQLYNDCVDILTTLFDLTYTQRDEILNNFFADVKIGYVEPAFELSTDRHGGDLDAL